MPAKGQTRRTLLLVNSEHNDDLIAADSDELLDGSNTSSRKFGEEDHAVDVVVLEKLDVGTHLGDLYEALTESIPDSVVSAWIVTDLLHVDHDEAINLRVLLLIETAVC